MGRVRIVSEDESFEFRPEGPGSDSVFTLRRLTQEAVEEIDARYRRKEFNKKTRTFDVVIPPETGVERSADIYDYVIRDWKDVEGPDGDPLPCTREVKRQLPGNIKVQIMEAADSANIAGLGENVADPTKRSGLSSPGSGISPSGPARHA